MTVPRIIACALLLGCGLANAALEGPPEEAAAAARSSTAVTSAGASYREVARTLPTGTVVREYADASGTVFAVAWSGPYKPNLKRLLGSHFASFKEAAAARERGANRTRAQVDAGDLVVQSAGHMGAFEGRAWLQSRLPMGFDPRQDLQ